MLIAHAPAGYLVSRFLAPRLEAGGPGYRAFVAWGMAGAVFPDIDLLWFVLVDHRQQPHHAYFTHWPLTWLLAMTLSLWLLRRRPATGAAAISFSIGGFTHMILDTVAGGIRWLAPLSSQSYVLFQPGPDYLGMWWFYFLFHWTFKLELGLTLAALVTACVPRRASPRSSRGPL